MAKVKWQDIALRQVKELYDYYYDHASPKVANNLMDDIIAAPEVLLTFPEAGAKEPLFEGVEPPFRYLVVRKHWKIIYFVLEDTCHIAVIWDTRNNPKELVNLLTT